MGIVLKNFYCRTLAGATQGECMAKQAGLAGWLAGFRWPDYALGRTVCPTITPSKAAPPKPNPSGDLSPLHNAIQDSTLISSAARRRTRRPLARRGAGTGR